MPFRNARMRTASHPYANECDAVVRLFAAVHRCRVSSKALSKKEARSANLATIRFDANMYTLVRL